eukprot:m.1214318 g.1214318  ORF g.1214318 m.1214318 type:complete len:73 (-) comp24603_c0_seq22:8-226(-)
MVSTCHFLVAFVCWPNVTSVAGSHRVKTTQTEEVCSTIDTRTIFFRHCEDTQPGLCMPCLHNVFLLEYLSIH